MSKPPPPNPASPPDFEQSLAEVEAIIQRIEAGEVGLEQSIAQYERGVQLIKNCRAVLDRVEQRVADLTAQMKAGIEGGGAKTPDARRGTADADEEPV
ncbi:MAG: exodeoxyribonuclease VII small subunit [Phycisphaerales bacterium]